MNGDVKKGSDHPSNGLPVKPATSHPGGQVKEQNHGLPKGSRHTEAQPQAQVIGNGVVPNGLSNATATKLLNGQEGFPPKIEEVAREYFVGLGTLIGHSAQDSWNNLSKLIGELSKVYVKPAAQPTIAGTNILVKTSGVVSNITKENLDKKEKLLNFAKDEKDVFIKLLVLLHWSKDVEGVSKIIDLNRWLRDRISRYGEVANDIARMKRYLAFIQVPNPDLQRAVEVLSGGTISGFSDLGYIPPKPLTDKEALKTLRSLNNILCTRLTLHEDLPRQLEKYHIHDGRVTFHVKDEFELDVSVFNDNPESQFCLADFRFVFSPTTNLPAGRAFDDLSFAANDVLSKTGLLGCYKFLHEFTLSYKINLLFKQALDLLQRQWSDNLRVEIIHRTLVVQYWINRHEPKSWIEIGIKSGVKRKDGQPETTKDLSIGLRWMQGGKEVEDANIELDVQNLSMESLLRQVIAQHTNAMLDSVFDSLMTIPLYQGGDLRLEQAVSATEPSDCSIEVEISKKSILKVAIEPVTGTVAITPTSNLCYQVEADLNRSRNMVEELPKRLSYLRMRTAEEDLISQAEATGWIILRSFTPSADEKAKWFSPPVHRVLFLRCSHWEPGHMLAATHGPQGDESWLLAQENTKWTSQWLRVESRHKQRQINAAYMRTLREYCSGVIVLQQNARHLNTISIRCSLGNIPPMSISLNLPHIALDFQPAKLDPILRPEWLSADVEHDRSGLSKQDKQMDEPYLCEAVIIKYVGQPLRGRATLEAIGSTRSSSVDDNMLAYLRHTIKDPGVSFRPEKGSFSISITASIGKPAMEDLLRRLLHLETLFACVKAVQDSPSATITFLSLDRIAMRYRPEAAVQLGIEVTFGTSSEAFSVKFTPIGENPHELIRQPLLKLLSRPRQSFSTSLVSILPLLSSSLPLISLFRELQTEKWYEAFGQKVDAESAYLLPRIHIMARHTTMFGIQLYAPNGFDIPGPSGPHRGTGMLVRFEMLSLARRCTTKWLLRPAIEEFESYSQPSYCCVPLKEKLEQEIFKASQPQGWQAMDSGAACSLDEPKPLLQATLGVVVAWLKDYHSSQTLKDRQAQPVAQKVNRPDTNTAPIQPAQTQKAKPNTSSNNRGGANKAPSKGPQEIITLD